MVVTSAGRSLIGPARRLLRDLEAASTVLVHRGENLRGTLDVCVSPALAANPLARYLATFRRRQPNVVVRISDLPPHESGAALISDGHVEVALVHLPDRVSPGTESEVADVSGVASDGICVVGLGFQEYLVAFPPETVLPDIEPLPLTRLPDIPMIVVPRGGLPAIQIEQALRRAGRSRPPAIVVQHREARMPLVMAGIGGTFLDELTARDANRVGLTVRRTNPAVRQPFGILFQPATASPSAQAFIDVARAPEVSRDATDQAESRSRH